MYSREQIIKDKSFKLFLENNKKIKENTINGYVMAVKSFSNSCEKPPTEIVEICKDDLRNKIPEFDQWILKALRVFKLDMESKGLKGSSIAKNIGILKAFLKDFHITPLPDIKIDYEKTDREPSEYLEKEDIKKASKYARPAYKAVYIVQSQTGLAITDTLQLKIKHFIKAVKFSDMTPRNWPLDEETIYTDQDLKEAIKKVDDKRISHGCLDLTRRKTGRRFYTFISYEGLLAIAEYLDCREHHLNENDFIFLKETDRIPMKKRKKVYSSGELEIMASTADSYTNRHNKKYFNNRKDKNGYCYFRTHKIRSWYSNQLYLAKIDWKDIKFLMGQRTNDVLERYIDVNAYNKLKENYEKALDNLKLNEKVIIKDTDRVKQVEAELELLNKELASNKLESEKKDEKIDKLVSRVEDMENLFNDDNFLQEWIKKKNISKKIGE